MLANKVTIDFDVFGTFMESIIISDLNSILIVTMDNTTHFLKKSSEPYKLLSSVSKSTIFCLGAGSGNKRLFFATL